MSSLTFLPSGHWQFTKPIQYVAEGVSIATFGITPTSAPTFLLPGVITDISETINVNSTMYRTLGLRNYYKNVSYGHAYAFEMGLSPDSNTLMKYGSEPAGGTGTIDEHLSFLVAQKLNVSGTLTETFKFYKGCKMNVLDINVAGQMVEVNTSWLARQITVPATTSGLSTPVFKNFADLTQTPWSHLQNGTNPLTLNSVTYPCNQWHINWNNNCAVDDENGTDLVDFIQQGNRDITGDFTILVGKDFALETDINADPLPARSGTYKLKSTATTSTITYTDLSIVQASPAQRAGDSTSYYIQYNYTAANAQIS